MRLSTHYYVLSLSERTNSLYECFRDTAIDVQNEGFPVEPFASMHGRAANEQRLQGLLRTVDRSFGKHYREEPLGLVVLGERMIQSAFDAVTTHEDTIIGRVHGDYTTTSLSDLGKIVWFVVKEAMSGLEDEAMRNLEIAKSAKKAAFGIDAVARRVEEWTGGTLLVEEDFRIPGSIQKAEDGTVISTDVDVRQAMDDVVDAVIEDVLETGGRVFFLPPGSMKSYERIALVLSEPEQAG